MEKFIIFAIDTLFTAASVNVIQNLGRPRYGGFKPRHPTAVTSTVTPKVFHVSNFICKNQQAGAIVIGIIIIIIIIGIDIGIIIVIDIGIINIINNNKNTSE